MNYSGASPLQKSRFTEFLIYENNLNDNKFKKWLFRRGMLFKTLHKWWGDQGMRANPHEGLDLYLYMDRQDRIHCLDPKTKIPVMYDGVVVGIIDDFLGKSVIMEHRLPDDYRRFCTIYGHISPYDSLHAGSIIREGDIIATLAGASKSEAKISPHLHISLGWPAKDISYERLDWITISTSNILALMDPLHVIGE